MFPVKITPTVSSKSKSLKAGENTTITTFPINTNIHKTESDIHSSEESESIWPLDDVFESPDPSNYESSLNNLQNEEFELSRKRIKDSIAISAYHDYMDLGGSESVKQAYNLGWIQGVQMGALYGTVLALLHTDKLGVSKLNPTLKQQLQLHFDIFKTKFLSFQGEIDSATNSDPSILLQNMLPDLERLHDLVSFSGFTFQCAICEEDNDKSLSPQKQNVPPSNDPHRFNQYTPEFPSDDNSDDEYSDVDSDPEEKNSKP